MASGVASGEGVPKSERMRNWKPLGFASSHFGNMPLLSLDLGSSSCGLVILSGHTILAHATIDVDPKNLRPMIDRITHILDNAPERIDRIAVEWSDRGYTPKGATPQQMAAIMFARETMAKLLDRIEQAAEARGVPVAKIACATWRARIGVTRRRRVGVAGFQRGAWAKLNPRKTSDDRMVKYALERLLGPGAAALEDVHQRDAAGTGLGLEMGPAEHVPGKRVSREKAAPPRKLGTRWQRKGHPSDAAFDRMLEAGLLVPAAQPWSR